jgi:hypothetical protein
MRRGNEGEERVMPPKPTGQSGGNRAAAGMKAVATRRAAEAAAAANSAFPMTMLMTCVGVGAFVNWQKRTVRRHQEHCCFDMRGLRPVEAKGVTHRLPASMF